MQAPTQEIASAFQEFAAASTPAAQKTAVLRFFTPDAALHHPLFTVSPGPLSRERVLAVYQWLSVVGVDPALKVKTTIYDSVDHVIILDVLQKYNLRFSPFRPVPVRYLCRVSLRSVQNKFYICKLECFYHPDALVAAFFPPLAPMLRFFLATSTAVSSFLAKSAQVCGIWRAPPGIAHDTNGVAGSNAPLTLKTAESRKQARLDKKRGRNVEAEVEGERNEEGEESGSGSGQVNGGRNEQGEDRSASGKARVNGNLAQSAKKRRADGAMGGEHMDSHSSGVDVREGN